MSYIAFTRDGEMTIDAHQCDRCEGYLVFYFVSRPIIAEDRREHSGIWPFRRTKIVRVERQIERREWVMEMREDYLNILMPAPELASGTEAGTVENGKSA